MQVGNLPPAIPQLPTANQKNKVEGMSTITKVLIVAYAILIPPITLVGLSLCPAVFSVVGLAFFAELDFLVKPLGCLALSILGITQCGKASIAQKPALWSAPVNSKLNIPHSQSTAAPTKSLSTNQSSLLAQTKYQTFIATAPAPAVNTSRLPSAQLKVQGFDIVEENNNYPFITSGKKYTVRNRTMQVVIDELNTAFKLPPNNGNAIIKPSSELLKDFIALAARVEDAWDSKAHSKYLPQGIQDAGSKIKFCRDYSSARKSNTNLLAMYDILAVPCKMDYDSNWERITGNVEPFYIQHAPVINIGECAGAEDFAEYADAAGKLNEAAYLSAMFKLFVKILEAQSETVAKHIVWFPFGMGTFLRHLDKNDPSYDENKLNQLRDRIAEQFVNALNQYYRLNPKRNAPIPDIHLCLPTGTNESDPNYLAFCKALESTSARIKPKTRLHLNADATDVAQKLANQHGAYTVNLVNGANRNQFGNHWFKDHALTAIDENLHRRSSLLSHMSLWLNAGCTPKPRTDDELETRLLALGAVGRFTI